MCSAQDWVIKNTAYPILARINVNWEWFLWSLDLKCCQRSWRGQWYHFSQVQLSKLILPEQKSHPHQMTPSPKWAVQKWEQGGTSPVVRSLLLEICMPLCLDFCAFLGLGQVFDNWRYFMRKNKPNKCERHSHKNSGLFFSFRWNNTLKGFHMPCK